ncbi:MAG: hypothetical protein IJU02_07085 [Lachnospiraceae bacterium]|nr:hypothetical protein [Lachnospiraceae bacterium]
MTSIKNIMNRITKHPLMQDIPMDVVVDYIVDFISVVGTPIAFEDKTAIIDIKKCRGLLPCDFYDITQVRLAGTHSNSYDNNTAAFRYTTDSFHMSENKPRSSDFTYKIQGNVIFTSPLEEGQIEIAYKAVITDEDGYPALPDNNMYLRAVEAYIKKQWFTIQFDSGKITPQVMQKVDQDYAWAVGQAQSSLKMPSIDQMQSITNMWNTLIPRHNHHRSGFVNMGTQEHLRNH